MKIVEDPLEHGRRLGVNPGMNSETSTMQARLSLPTKRSPALAPPRSMLLLRRAADAAGYAIAGAPDDEPARGFSPVGPAVALASFCAVAALVFASY